MTEFDIVNELEKILDMDSMTDFIIIGAFLGVFGYIVFNIVAFGVISLVFYEELAARSVMARVFCGYVSLFWAIRLVIQLFFFDAKPYLRNTFLKIGYHGLTLVFVWQTAVFGWVACKI